MLNEPQLIEGLGTLLKDEDPTVIKRTIRVFANVYRHSLNMLSTGELDEQTFSNAWPTVSTVANELIEIIENSENEGITVHIVRFLEAAVLAHILSDITRYPDILSKTSPTVTKIVAGLTDLLDTDYVGGSAFIVGIRAMITIACYKEDMRKEVIDLIERKITKPAATLFDHHIRSLNKMLQRNLFRLLRREQSEEGKERLIEMMVKVGVKRKMLVAWAPQINRKRSAPSQLSPDDIIGRTTPPHKRSRDGDITPPRTPEYQYVPTATQPTSQAIPEYIPTKIVKSNTSLPNSQPNSQPNSRPNSQPNSRPNSKPNSPSRSPEHSNSGRSTPVYAVNNSKADEINLNFDLLQKIINGHSKTQEESNIEIIAKALETPQTVEFVLECLDQLEDIPDEDLLMNQLREVGSDENAKKDTLAALLVKLLPKNVIDQLKEQNEVKAITVNTSTPISPTHTSIIQETPATSSTPFFSNQDIDLRNLMNPKGGDVDMRMFDPRNMQQQQINTHEPRAMIQTSRDPRSKPSELPHTSVAQTSSRDPRGMADRDPRRPAESRDPRVAVSIMNSQEMGRKSPNFMIERNLQDVDRRSPIFMQDMGRRSPSFMQNAQDMGRRSPNCIQNAQDMGRRSPNLLPNAQDMGRRSPNFMPKDPRMRNERVQFTNGPPMQNFNHGVPLGNLNPNTMPRYNGININNNMPNYNPINRNHGPVNQVFLGNNNNLKDQNDWAHSPPPAVLNRPAMRMSAS